MTYLGSGRLILALLFVVGATMRPCAAARAQPGGGVGEAEVVVRASPGPALWRVTRGRSELVILGSVTPTRHNGAWNSRAVADALQGARVLLLSPGSTPGLAWADRFPESRRYQLRQPLGRTLSSEIGPDTARFDRMAAVIGKGPSQYGGYRPGPAGMVLLEDSWRARELTGSKLDDAIVALAGAAHVRVVRVYEGGALPLIDAMPSMSIGQHTACIREAMDQFDWEGANASAGFEAWANGDLAALRRLYRPLSLCLDSIPGGVARRDRARAVWLKALSQALATPGLTVAVADVSELLEPSGLLAALRAEGAVVIPPRGETEAPAPSATVAVDRSLASAEPVDLIDPEILPLRTPPVLPTLALPDPAAAPAGRLVDLAAGDAVCETDTVIGSLFTHVTCHTRAEWKEMEKHRDLDQIRRLRQFSGRYWPLPVAGGE